MTAVLSREQIRAYDRHAIERCAVPGLVLMENAGRGAAEILVAELATALGIRHPAVAAGGATAVEAATVVVVAGPGNNGGDGFVVGRHLLARGPRVKVLLVGDREQVRGDARHNLEAYVGVGGELESLPSSPDALERLGRALAGATVAVDALFGTGLDRPIEGFRRAVVERLNAASCLKIALDIPSGIDADTGAVLGVAVRADHTVTFARPKLGLFAGPGADHAGRVHEVGLGLPDAAILAAVGCDTETIEPARVRAALGERAAGTHKYGAGNLLVVAGRPGKVGAALLAARAALRTGAGLVTIGTSAEAANAIDPQALEVMTARLDPGRLAESLAEAWAKRDAVAIGPGMGLDEVARELAERVVLEFEGPAIVDADAISHFAGRPELLRAARGPRVLTPHAGELARLVGTTSRAVEADRFGAAAAAAATTGQVVVLKGRHTIVATPEGRRWLCTRGNALLGTAGSGDVLTGMIGALLCLAPPAAAAAAGVFLHADVADRWRGTTGADRGLCASDIAAGIPAAMAALSRPRGRLASAADIGRGDSS